MKKKRILIIAGASVLLVVIAVFVFRIYPLCRLYGKLSGAESVRFEGIYHLENDQDDYSGEEAVLSAGSSSLLELLRDGRIEGEYTGGTLHCFIYQEDMDTALLEFYHGENSDIINIRQIVEFGIDYLDAETMFPVKQLFSMIDTSAECYATEEQFEAITGLSVLPSFDELEESGNFSKLLLAVLLKADQITVGNDSSCVESSDNTVIPFDFSVEFTIPEERCSIEIPESDIDDGLIPVYRKIYEMAEGVLAGE
ncbi:MAG: hypothetical protein ACI4E0_04415 [Blautia sp.]